MNSELNTVWKHSRVYSLANILNRGAGLVLLPVYVNILTPEQYGLYALLTIITEMTAVLLILGLGQALVRFFVEVETEEERHQVASTTFVLFGCIVIVFALIAPLLARATVAVLLDDQRHVWLFTVGFWALAVTALFNVQLQYYLVQKRSWSYLWISLAKVLSFLVTNILFVVSLDMGVLGIAYGTLLSAAMITFFLQVRILRETGTTVSLTLARRLINFGLPLVPAVLLDTLLATMDRFFLNHLQTPQVVGQYALAERVGSLLRMFVIVPFGQIWIVRKLELLKTGDDADGSNEVFLYFFAIFVIGALGMALFAPEIVTLLAAPDYAPAAHAIPLLAATQILLAIKMHFEVGVFHSGKTHFMFWASAIAVAVGIPTFYFTIKLWGLLGGALAVFLVQSVRVAVITIFACRVSSVGKGFPWYRLLILVALASGVAAIGLMQNNGEPSLPWIFAKIALLLGFVLAAIGSPVIGPQGRAAILDLVSRKIPGIRRLIPMRINQCQDDPPPQEYRTPLKTYPMRLAGDGGDWFSRALLSVGSGSLYILIRLGWFLMLAFFSISLVSEDWVGAIFPIALLLGITGLITDRRIIAGVWMIGAPTLFVLANNFLDVLPFVTAERLLFGLLLFMILIDAVLKRGDRPHLDAVELFGFLFLAIALLSMLTTLQGKTMATVRIDLAFFIQGYFMPVFTYFIARRLGWTPRYFTWLLYGLVAAGVFQAFTGALQYFLGIRWFVPTWTEVINEGRATGTMPNSTEFASVLMVTLLIALYLYCECREKAVKAILLLSALAIFAGILISKTRAPWVTTVIAIVVIFFGDPRTRGLIATSAVLGIVALIVAIPWIISSGLFYERIGEMSPIYNRLALYATAGNMIVQNPFFGIGFGRASFQNLKMQYITSFGSISAQWAAEVGVPHNEFLHIAALTGLLGILAYLLFYRSLYRSISRHLSTLSTGKPDEFSYFGVYLKGMLIALLLTGLFVELGPFICFIILTSFLIGSYRGLIDSAHAQTPTISPSVTQ